MTKHFMTGKSQKYYQSHDFRESSDALTQRKISSIQYYKVRTQARSNVGANSILKLNSE